MADQGRWFKLWCDASDDPDLDSLSIMDFGRWAKLGALVKAHGTAGSLTIPAPAPGLCAKFQVPDFEALIGAISRLPHLTLRRDNSTVTGVTIATVTFHNWLKYQGDFSRDRVSKFRQLKRSKRRGEEKREEEKRKIPPIPPRGHANGFDRFWSAYPKKKARGDAEKAWKQTANDRPPLDELVAAVTRQARSEDWTKDGGQFIPLPAGWLRKKRWLDESDNKPDPITPQETAFFDSLRKGGSS